ncbi:unnamed protein product [Phytophthora fragariaefolia]|uniref:Centrosomal protein of 162 kDa n=1 Tax=Phytophthora fragariaefolia TaxID=1490495 RepID=A0A9W7CGT0_9STRA|nr:unnamed protein product [Phytophthora fragariaefolia]
MSSPAFASSVQKEEHDSDDSDVYTEKKKKKKEEFKTLAKKAAAKTTPISMEDRIAEILKRTGSTQYQAGEKSDGDEHSDTVNDFKRDEVKDAKQVRVGNGDSGSNAEDSNLSDSLGVGSADFEVPTPSRYEQQQATFLESEQDESTTEKDEYGDDEFELDHSSINDKDCPPPFTPAQDYASVSLQENKGEPFVSQFDKMKVHNLNRDCGYWVLDLTRTGAEEPVPEQPNDVHLSGSLANANVPYPLEASDTFGYGDDAFEETEESKQGVSPAKVCDQASGVAPSISALEYGADYEDDAFEADTGAAEETTRKTSSGSSQVINENHKSVPQVGAFTVDKDARVNALLAAKYGDFYTLGDDDDEKHRDNAEQPAQAPSLSPIITTTETMTSAVAPVPSAFATPTNPVESPPSSPPPPPPPDEDEDEDEDLNCFTLEAAVDDTNSKGGSAPVHLLGSAAPAQENRSIPPAADRFRNIENHVASLRFIQPSDIPKNDAMRSPEIEAVHPVSARTSATNQDGSSRAPPPFIEPMSISFDASLLVEDEETQREIDEFVRSSQILRQEHQSAAQRASIARENGLMLRLQQAQRQILQLKEHIKATATNNPPALRRDIYAASKSIDTDGGTDKDGTVESEVMGVAASAISQAAYNKLQKEIKTQDNLIAAFQKENERLMQQLKQVRQEVQYDVHEANEKLRREIKILEDQAGASAIIGSGGDLTSKAQYRAAVEARLEAEAHVLALQEELAGVRLSYQQKLNEVTLELDRVKKSKVELECRYEGVDLTQVALDTEHARELQTDLDLCKKEHAHALTALQKKLDWYVENQRLLDDQDDELRRLRRMVAANSSGTPAGTPSKEDRSSTKMGRASPARSHRRSPNDIRRIQELEGRLAELEEAMRRRHPDSLANLILATRRADDESKMRALEHDYEDKLAALSRELEQAHEASETRLASFRQQQEKLLLQYRRKIKEQEKQLKQLGKTPLSHRPTSKDSNGTSEAELTKVRRFYTDKIKELERKWEAKYRSLRKQQYSGLSSNQQVQEGLTYADSSLVIANLQRQIREQELELKQEKSRVEQLEAESQLADMRRETLLKTNDIQSEPTQEDKQRELESQISDLKEQLEDSESARARLAQTLTTLQTLGLARALNSETTPTATDTSPVEPAISKQNEAELDQLRHDLSQVREALRIERAASTEKIGGLEKQIIECSDRNALLEAQLAGSQRELHSLQSLVQEAERHNRSLEVQARRVPELEEEVLSLRHELELPRTPSMVQYRSLELKVATLEQKHKLREAELKVVLERAMASTRLEQLSRERAHQAAIAAKNAEISSFKRQLEEILDELAQLQQPPSSRFNARAKTTYEPVQEEL